jgi:hypothetical protein
MNVIPDPAFIARPVIVETRHRSKVIGCARKGVEERPVPRLEGIGFMVFSRQIQHAALAVLAAALALVGSRTHAQDVPASAADATGDGTIEQVIVERPRIAGARLQIDNDLFVGRELDRDYTGGFGITIDGKSAHEGFLSLDPILASIDKLVSSDDSNAGDSKQESNTYYARQFGFMAFTPGNTLVAEPQPDDRPYASLLFTSNGRVRVDPDNLGAWTSSFTIGLLGLSASEHIHATVHELVGSEAPKGYDNQIAAGGEPTARYTLARQDLLVAHPTGNFDVKTTVQGSVGYLTEASAAISVRVGRFDTPWWSFAPELTDYMAAPVPVEARGVQRELYVFFGARVEARAYNAFLQGQFRDSTVTYSYDEIEPVVATAWIGVVTQIFEQTQLSYTLNYQTAEVRDGKAARDAIWGGVQIAHTF